MSTRVGFGWVHKVRWVMAASVLLGIALVALAWEGDTGSLSVKLRAGLSAAEQAAVIARHGGTEQSAVAPLRIHVVRVPAAVLPAALAAYQTDPQVESAEEVHSRRAEWLPNDPQIGTQWALERIGWPAVYSTQTPAGTATLALLDTGVDGTHPDLAGRLVPGTSFLDASDGLTDPSGHGTRLAGLISAVADNGEGIAGVAYAGVKVMPVRVLDADGVGPDSAIVAGIVWAADRGADVILMGFSSPDSSQHLQDAIDYAWAKGAVLVAPTGNGGLDTPTYPAANRGVIGIAATDQDDGLADFSNRGPEVFLIAPGVDLVTTEGPDGYTAVSGTSPAAALTAGAAALLKAFDPTLTNGVLLGRLARGAAPVGDPQDPDYTAKYGYGRLSLSGAVADAQGAQAQDPVEPLGAAVAVAAAGGEGAATGPVGGGAAGGVGGTGSTPDRLYTTSAASPTVTIVGTSNLGANQVTLSLQSSATGTGWFTLLPGSGTACGTGAQAQAGQDSTGAAAFRRGPLGLTADTAGAYTIRNLVQGNAYTVCFTADDGTTLQGTPATAVLTTTAATALSATWGAVGSAGFSAGRAVYTSLAFAPGGTPYVAYRDEGNWGKAAVMRFDGTAWVAVGSAGFSARGTTYTSLAFAPDGTPYVAYEDWGNSYKATVTKFNGTAWVTVGSAGFSAGVVNYTSLAFAPDGTPYVAYVDWGNSQKATVMKFNGTAWVTVGSAGFSAGVVNYTSLAFAPDGTPYMAYKDRGNSLKATVMKYDGSAWVTVGGAGFSAADADFTSLAFAPDGTPYVAYQDWGNSYKATVMKFSGTAWVTLGSAGFSAGGAYDISLAFAPDGTPYVAYQDRSESYRATVMRFNGTAWVTVGGAGFSDGAASTSLAFCPDGTPYVAYTDEGSAYKATVMKLFPPAATTTMLSAAPNPADVGTLVSFTATVGPAAATGTVTFKDGTVTLGTAPLAGGQALLTTAALATGSHAITAVYGGDANHQGSASADLTQEVLTTLTVATNPAGLTVQVDGTPYTAPHTFAWTLGSSHSIAVAAIQGESLGRRYAFAAWSDGGARTHTITVPAAAATLTAGFNTQYQLSTAITPAGTGTVSPATGGWYAAGTLVTVKAFPSAGYGFVGWEGPVADPQASTTSLTLGAPAAIVARVVGSPVLTATIAGKSGPAQARVWTLRLRNSGQSTAQAARIGTLTLTQTFGPACTPVVASQFPVMVGDLPVGGAANGAVTIDFGACTAAARFTAAIGYGANGGAVTGTNSYGNQFR